MEDLGPLTYSVLKFTKSKVDYLSINTSMLKISLPTTLVDTPLELNVKYKKDDGILFSGLIFYRILLAVKYPPKHFSCGQSLSQIMTQPTQLHLCVVKRIIQYLMGTSKHGMFFPTIPI